MFKFYNHRGYVLFRFLILNLISLGIFSLSANNTIPIYSFAGDLHAERLYFLKIKGFNPRVIYDIGAYKGNWSKNIKRIFPDAEFYLFEACDKHENEIAQIGSRYFINVLGEKDDEQFLFYSNGSTGDSLKKENTTYYSEGSYESKLVKTTSLNTHVNKHKMPLPDLIKIDVQGAEKMVLKGGSDVIQHAEAIILEVNILEYNESAPLMKEMIDYMEEIGFIAHDLLETHYGPYGDLMQMDFLFLRRNSKFIKSGILW